MLRMVSKKQIDLKYHHYKKYWQDLLWKYLKEMYMPSLRYHQSLYHQYEQVQ